MTTARWMTLKPKTISDNSQMATLQSGNPTGNQADSPDDNTS
jgi:hypothetical protein